MLYNPRWERDSLAGLRNWLARQPADERYAWSSCQHCVVGKYLEAHGVSHLDYCDWCHAVPGAGQAVPASFSTVWGEPNTMGRALERLDAWMAEQG
jgi:hypothetical protein